MCYARNEDACEFSGSIPDQMFFQCPSNEDIGTWITSYASFYYFLWFASSIWICSHIWIPKSQRLASTEQMFGTPYYCGLLPDQCMALNRRSDSGIMKFRLDVAR